MKRSRVEVKYEVLGMDGSRRAMRYNEYSRIYERNYGESFETTKIKSLNQLGRYKDIRDRGAQFDLARSWASKARGLGRLFIWKASGISANVVPFLSEDAWRTRKVKLNAAKKLEQVLDGNNVNFSVLEKKALNEGKLGRIAVHALRENKDTCIERGELPSWLKREVNHNPIQQPNAAANPEVGDYNRPIIAEAVDHSDDSSSTVTTPAAPILLGEVVENDSPINATVVDYFDDLECNSTKLEAHDLLPDTALNHDPSNAKENDNSTLDFETKHEEQASSKTRGSQPARRPKALSIFASNRENNKAKETEMSQDMYEALKNLVQLPSVPDTIEAKQSENNSSCHLSLRC